MLCRTYTVNVTQWTTGSENHNNVNVGSLSQGQTDALHVTPAPSTPVDTYRLYSQVYCGFLLVNVTEI